MLSKEEIEKDDNYWKGYVQNYIEKDKIRKKIEELEKEYKEALEENSTKAFIVKCQIEILKELLKKNKKYPAKVQRGADYVEECLCLAIFFIKISCSR